MEVESNELKTLKMVQQLRVSTRKTSLIEYAYDTLQQKVFVDAYLLLRRKLSVIERILSLTYHKEFQNLCDFSILPNKFQLIRSNDKLCAFTPTIKILKRKVRIGKTFSQCHCHFTLMPATPSANKQIAVKMV